MIKLAFIDLDGVVTDNTARFEKAEEAKQAFLSEARNNPAIVEGFARQKEATNVYWQTAFNPDLVELDTLIEDVKQDLQMVRYANGYEIFFLTSRPETMRLATETWLYQHDIQFLTVSCDPALIMKPPAAQFVKTVTWKALTVQMLTSLYSASDVLFIDDEPVNRDALSVPDTAHKRVIVASSLSDALEKLDLTS